MTLKIVIELYQFDIKKKQIFFDKIITIVKQQTKQQGR